MKENKTKYYLQEEEEERKKERKRCWESYLKRKRAIMV